MVPLKKLFSMNSCVDMPVVSDGVCSHRLCFVVGSSSLAKKSMASLISSFVGWSYMGVLFFAQFGGYFITPPKFLKLFLVVDGCVFC